MPKTSLFLATIGVLLLLSLLVGCAQIPTGKVVAEDVSPVETEQQQPLKEEVKEIIYSMNQDIDVDYLSYKVTRVETFTEMGASMFKKETNGKFIKVYLTITNNARETKQIFTPRFRIIDSKERQYDRLSDDMLYIADYLEFGKQLQPSLTTSGAIVFELPNDSEDLKLIIRGDWLSVSQVKVALSNIRNSGTDTTLKAEQEKMMEEVMNKCSAPFECSSSCPQYMDVGQKDCPPDHLCCMQ